MDSSEKTCAQVFRRLPPNAPFLSVSPKDLRQRRSDVHTGKSDNLSANPDKNNSFYQNRFSKRFSLQAQVQAAPPQKPPPCLSLEGSLGGPNRPDRYSHWVLIRQTRLDIRRTSSSQSSVRYESQA